MKRRETILTVGMPVCNGMPWLQDAVESLLAQTNDAFGILCIVDGGTDQSAEYLRSVRDERLRVMEQTHAGVTATLNRMLREVRTPWLVRQDADDVSYPQRMAKLLEAIGKYPSAGLIYSLADYHPRDKCAGRFRCSRGTPRELRAIVESGYLLSICHSTVALNVEKALAVGGYRMNLHVEDADLWWRMARHYEIHCIPEPLVGFRLNAESVSSRSLEQQQLAGMYVQYLLLSDLWEWRPKPLAEIADALSEMLRPARIAAKEWLRRGNISLAEGRRTRAAVALARAMCASPRYVISRLLDEFGSGMIANGVAPQLFLERKEALW